MKKYTLIVALTALHLGLFAQNTYKAAMHSALEDFGKAQNIEQLQAAASQFDRIAAAESTEWLPAYYSSLIYSIIVFQLPESDKKEAFLKKSEQMLEKGLANAPKESELYALQGMIYQAFMAMDPMKNGALYAPKMNGAFQMSIKLNPENPRPYYLQAIATMHTPEEFGGGKKVAQPLLEQAMMKFNNFNKTSHLSPDWGKEDCQKNLTLCKQ